MSYGVNVTMLSLSDKGYTEMIDTYGRCSAGTLVRIGKEMAEIETILERQAGLSHKLLGSALSAVYLFGQWYFQPHHPDAGTGSLAQ